MCCKKVGGPTSFTIMFFSLGSNNMSSSLVINVVMDALMDRNCDGGVPRDFLLTDGLFAWLEVCVWSRFLNDHFHHLSDAACSRCPNSSMGNGPFLRPLL